MLIAQLAPAASRRPHVLSAIAKSPIVVMLEMVSGADRPLMGLVSMTVWGPLVVPIVRLPKVRLVGDKTAEGVVRLGPANGTVCGLFDALSVMVTAPAAPGAIGTNETVAVQFAPTSSDLTQLSVSAKLPLATTLVMVSTSVPVLVSVTVWGSLPGLAKLRLAGDSPTAGPLAGIVVVVVVVGLEG